MCLKCNMTALHNYLLMVSEGFECNNEINPILTYICVWVCVCAEMCMFISTRVHVCVWACTCNSVRACVVTRMHMWLRPHMRKWPLQAYVRVCLGWSAHVQIFFGFLKQKKGEPLHALQGNLLLCIGCTEREIPI